jgi:hypothetical protein
MDKDMTFSNTTGDGQWSTHENWSPPLNRWIGLTGEVDDPNNWLNGVPGPDDDVEIDTDNCLSRNIHGKIISRNLFIRGHRGITLEDIEIHSGSITLDHLSENLDIQKVTFLRYNSWWDKIWNAVFPIKMWFGTKWWQIKYRILDWWEDRG